MLVEDLRLLSEVSDVYRSAVPEIARTLRNSVTTGATFIEKEQKIEKRVNIVMLTALNSANDAMDSFCNAQSAAYLVKPVSKTGLFNVMSKLGVLRT